MIRMSLLIALVIASFAADASAQVRLPPRPEILNKLDSAAEELLDFPFVSRIYAHSWTGKRFEWNLTLEGEVSEYLQSQEIEPLDDRVVQFSNWAITINQQLLQLTRTMVLEEGDDPSFNPETDYELSVAGEVLPAAELKRLKPRSDERWDSAYVGATFIGSQLASLYSHGNSQPVAIAPLDIPEDIEVTATIKLDENKIPFRSSITGSVLLRNTGNRRIPIGYYDVRRSLTVLDGEGNEPEDFYHMLMHAPTPDWWERFLEPAETYEEDFVIYTDEGAVPASTRGYELELGKWTLVFTDLAAEHNIPTITEPVVFEITGNADSYRGPRTKTILSRGDNLIVFRDKGWIEAVDPLTGERKGMIHRDNSYLGALWAYSTIVFSTDGRLASFGSFREEPVEWVAFYGDQPDTTSVPMTGNLRPIHQNGGSNAIGFGAQGRTAIFESDHGAIILDIDTGEERGRLELQDYGYTVSPDGRYIVSTFDPQGRFADGSITVISAKNGWDEIGGGATMQLTIVDIDNPDATMVRTIKGRGEIPLVTLGLNGAYFVHGLHKGVTYQPYDKDGFVVFGSEHMSMESESADGSLVALRSPGGHQLEGYAATDDRPTSIEVWDVAQHKQLYVIEANGRHLRARFVGTPARLVVLERLADSRPKWYSEQVQIYNGKTGEFLNNVDLTPRGSFPAIQD